MPLSSDGVGRRGVLPWTPGRDDSVPRRAFLGATSRRHRRPGPVRTVKVAPASGTTPHVSRPRGLKGATTFAPGGGGHPSAGRSRWGAPLCRTLPNERCYLKIRVAYIWSPCLRGHMEPLQRLTRRQVETLQSIRALETPKWGAPLKRIAASMHVSAPSALGHLTPLEGLGLIERYRGKSRLTARGRGTLLEYQRHHRVVESLFSSIGLAPSETCAAAREIDLAISHRTVEEVCRARAHPATCPHGEPIPACSSEGGGR
jgi:Mn-dependent DtxR family transcriptional regulator